MVDVSILTVYGEYDPFADTQQRCIKNFSDFDYEHLRVKGGNQGSRSHGPMLDYLTRKAQGDIVVALDSDAFPVADWSSLIFSLDRFKAIGIKHSRFGFIHPSFFVVRKEDIESSWQRVGEKDVGRVLSEKLEVSGPVHKMESTAFYAKNPDPLDPDIGSVYEDTIFHNWYTYRAFLQQDPDGVPSSVVMESVDHALERYADV